MEDIEKIKKITQRLYILRGIESVWIDMDKDRALKILKNQFPNNCLEFKDKNGKKVIITKDNLYFTIYSINGIDDGDGIIYKSIAIINGNRLFIYKLGIITSNSIADSKEALDIYCDADCDYNWKGENKKEGTIQINELTLKIFIGGEKSFHSQNELNDEEEEEWFYWDGDNFFDNPDDLKDYNEDACIEYQDEKRQREKIDDLEDFFPEYATFKLLKKDKILIDSSFYNKIREILL